MLELVGSANHDPVSSPVCERVSGFNIPRIPSRARQVDADAKDKHALSLKPTVGTKSEESLPGLLPFM